MWMIECGPGDTSPVHARSIRDTMLKSQLTHQYRTMSGAAKAGFPSSWVPNDLATVLRTYLDVDIKKSIDHDTTDWTGKWSSDMIEYMLEDIDYLEPVHEILMQELKQQGQLQAALIEDEVVFGTAWMTINGMMPDQERWKSAVSLWRQQHDMVLEDLLEIWPGVLNYNSPKQLQASSGAVLGWELPSTRKSTLKQLIEYEPIRTLLDQRHLATRLKNWGPTFLRQYLCPQCQRLHPSWNQIGTETARFSCSKPNVQQFPRDPEFRRMIITEPGYVVCSLDYSAIEVVAAAVFSQDLDLLQACRTGDPHLATAKLISGDDSLTKSDPRRQNAKIANFGLLFGGGVGALISQARDLFDVIWTEKEAREIFNAYFALYRGLWSQRQLAYDRVQTGPQVLEITNTVGFRRYLEGHNRKATSVLNTRIQSDAGYGMKRSFHYLNEYGVLPYLIGVVHDEFLFEFPEEDAPTLQKWARLAMLKGMHDVLGAHAPVTVETKTAPFWT